MGRDGALLGVQNSFLLKWVYFYLLDYLLLLLKSEY